MKLSVLAAIFSVVFEARLLNAESPLKFQWIDKSVDPSSDFYTYANGVWLNTTVIPDDETSIDGFYQAAKQNEAVIKDIIEGAAKDKNSRLGNLYLSGINMAQRNKAGSEPLEAAFKLVDEIKCSETLARTIAVLQRKYKAKPFFSFEVFTDLKNSSKNSPFLSSGGTGLYRSYYLEEDKEPIRQAYTKYMDDSFKLANLRFPGKNISKSILKLETLLANNSVDINTADNNDLNNPFSLDNVRRKLCPKFEWSTYLKALGFRQPSSTVVIVDTPDFFKALCASLDVQKKENLLLIKSYLTWTLLVENQQYLGQKFFDNAFSFFETVLNGQQKPPPLWKNVLRAVSDFVPDLLSQKFVAKAFPPQAKANALNMVNLIRDAFCTRLSLNTKVSWLQAPTRAKAVEKCKAIVIKIGYPDKWNAYTGLKISKDMVYMNNILSAHEWAFDENIKLFGKPVDRSVWSMTSFEVNAYYDSQYNEIVFPAAILQPPFFYQSPQGSAVDPFTIPANFGSIGIFIGHEITHAFDDSGSQFDAAGNLADWWTAKDKEAFKQRGQAIIDQFNNFTIFGEHINGELTEGENTADLGGVKAAYDAFQSWMTKNGRVANIMGFSAEQQFFIAYAQSWATLQRKESVLSQIESDPHSPAIFRVNGPLSNFQAFITAFNVTPGKPMYNSIKKRVDIW